RRGRVRARHARARDGRDHAALRDLADLLALVLGDQEAAVRRGDRAIGPVELRQRRLAPVATGAGRVLARGARAGDRGDDPLLRHLADALVRAVGDEEAAARERADAGRLVQVRLRRLAAVATEGARAGDARDGRDRPVGR